MGYCVGPARVYEGVAGVLGSRLAKKAWAYGNHLFASVIPSWVW